MAKARKRDIPYLVIVKQPSGKKDKWGRNTWTEVSRKNGVVAGTSYKDLKKNTYDKVRKNNSNKNNPKMYANYEDRFSVRKTRRLRSVTKTFKNGTKEITYFK